MSPFKHCYLFLATVFLFGASHASANDMFSETGIGGLKMGKTTHTSMLSEKLLLSAEKVEVEYEFLNHSDEDETATVSFPLPAVALCNGDQQDMGHCDDENVLNLKFETWVDGKKLPPAKFIDKIVSGDPEYGPIDRSGQDLTDILKKYGLSKTVYAEGNEQKILDLSSQEQDQLEKDGLISWYHLCDQVFLEQKNAADGSVTYQFNGADVTDDVKKTGYTCMSYPICTGHVNALSEETKQEMAKKGWIKLGRKDLRMHWELQRTYFWEQTFRKHQMVKIKHSYKPLLGAGQGIESELEENKPIDGDERSSFCVDEKTRSTILEKAKIFYEHTSGMAHGYYWLKYILTSANSWDGPIQDFTLTIKKSSPEDIVSTCFDGIKKIDDVTFTVKIKNFRPEKDISILFY